MSSLMVRGNSNLCRVQYAGTNLLIFLITNFKQLSRCSKVSNPNNILMCCAFLKFTIKTQERRYSISIPPENVICNMHFEILGCEGGGLTPLQSMYLTHNRQIFHFHISKKLRKAVKLF